jgi:hypothetical protein
LIGAALIVMALVRMTLIGIALVRMTLIGVALIRVALIGTSMIRMPLIGVPLIDVARVSVSRRRRRALGAFLARLHECDFEVRFGDAFQRAEVRGGQGGRLERAQQQGALAARRVVDCLRALGFLLRLTGFFLHLALRLAFGGAPLVVQRAAPF